MERCGIKDVEAASGEESPMARCPAKGLKAAAALAALASMEAAASKDGEEELAAVSMEKELAEAAAKQAEGKEFQKAAAAAGDDYTDSEDEGEGMTSLEYIKTYKLLPPHEVELIMQAPLEREPFTNSYAYKDLCADPNATQEDIAWAQQEHEAQQDMRIEFRQRVRSEYKANGYVTINDEYVAMRIRTEELSNRLWEEAFADYDDEIAAFDNEVDVEEVAH